ncbi:nuclear transport factor 2 family protein [Pseudarthrobacter sp. NPDC080039]|uniref:nuclear transport factor 2 family protein n=1 Tax=unclassified Pseudarthrobacter TaxID=2647000 RepID=UPI00344D8E82
MENKDVIRRVYDLFPEGKLAEIIDLFAPDAVWSIPGQNTVTGQWQGKDAIANELLPKLATCSTFQASLIDVADGGEHTFALRRNQAERAGQSIDYLVCDVLKIQDGLIHAIHTYPWDARAVDAFWR